MQIVRPIAGIGSSRETSTSITYKWASSQIYLIALLNSFE